MRNRLLAKLAPLFLLASLALAPAASAYNDGRGFYGATNDKAITDAGFILIIFFPTFMLPDEHAPAPSGKAQGRAQSSAEGADCARPPARRLVAARCRRWTCPRPADETMSDEPAAVRYERRAQPR